MMIRFMATTGITLAALGLILGIAALGPTTGALLPIGITVLLLASYLP